MPELETQTRTRRFGLVEHDRRIRRNHPTPKLSHNYSNSCFASQHRGKIVSENIIRQEAKILKATTQTPPEGSTHWSGRKLPRHLGVSHSRVARVWARAGIQPHRLRRYMASTDPEFEEKAADIIWPLPQATA